MSEVKPKFEVILATGDTYPNRRQLRSAGGVWLQDEKAYALPSTSTLEIPGVTMERVTLAYDPFRPLDKEELRAARQAKIDRKKARLLDRAERAERRSGEAMATISPQERSFLRLAEPVKVGHHSQRKHQKLIDRFNRAFIKSMEEASSAVKLRKRADWMTDAKVKGDAAAKRAKANEEARAALGVGDTVKAQYYGLTGVIVSMNPKSIRVNFGESKGVLSVSPRELVLVAKGDASAAEAAKLVHRFKKGDRVGYAMWGPSGKTIPATVIRRTSIGYTIEYFIHSELKKTTSVREIALVPA